ncbi:hypothetical protein ILYODFUR_025007 [Ilyodon furcidens]|uniref:Uncharacterized protein n=1 Tax=Ilyodon furcidens TaxID=33524 RepID=A0ABV0U092_9TELE
MFKVADLLEGELLLSLKSFTASKRFPSRIVLYFAPSTFPSALTSFLVPAEEKHPCCVVLPPVWGWCKVLVFLHRILRVGHLTKAYLASLTGFVANCKQDFLHVSYQEYLSFCHSSIKTRLLECIGNIFLLTDSST